MKNQESKTQIHATTLYKVVYESAHVKMGVFVLFAFLLLQPVAPVAAAFEEGSVTSGNTEASVEEEAEPTIEEEVLIPEVENTSVSEVVLTQEEGSEGVVDENQESVIEEEVVTDGESNGVDTAEEILEVIGTTTEPTASSSEPILEEEQGQDEEVIVPVEEVPLEETLETEEETATTTPIATTTESVLISDHNAHAYEFNTEDCAVVGDGAFYCNSAKDLPEEIDDGVFSAPDVEGDLEIYVRLDGVERALTSNSVDDSAPYFDALSNRIVWHANVNDRYQIFSYDLNSNEQIRLTDTNYNNMEPVAYENITLWQAWVNNNWEIMMYDGTEVRQLTENSLQDISPHMREGYIVWQTQFKEGWQVAVYDQEKDSIEYIETEGSMNVENPRFVLVYDSTNEQGDTQTVGYDFDNKVTFTLASLPPELPEELPEPDQTGETRALIQSKQNAKEGEAEVIDITPDNSNNGTTSPSHATSTPGTLDLSNGTSTATTSPVIVGDITDVVIPPLATSSVESIDIEDLVIPQLFATSTEEIS